MICTQSTKNEKDLNKSKSKILHIKRGVSMKKEAMSSKLKSNELVKAIKEAQKDPEFIKEINKFIKATTNIYKLH